MRDDPNNAYRAIASTELSMGPAEAGSAEGAGMRAPLDAEDPGWRALMGRSLLFRSLASLLVAGAFAWLMHVGALPLMPSAAALATVHWWTLPAYLVVWSLVHILRSARWKLLLNPIADVPMRRVLAASFIGHLAIMLLPLRAGELVRPLLLREKGRLSTWSALATIVAERLVDGLVLSAILVVGLALARPLHPLPEHVGNLPLSVGVVPRAAVLVLIAFNLGVGLMIALYVGRHRVSRWIESVIGRWFPRAAAWSTERWRLLCGGLKFLTVWRHSIPFVVLTAATWLIAASSGWLLGWGVGFSDFDFPRACVVTGMLALGTLLPNAPGFWGAFQFSSYAGLAIFTPPEDVLSTGATFVFFSYLFQLLVIVLFALWVMPLGRGSSLAIPARFGLGSSAPHRLQTRPCDD